MKISKNKAFEKILNFVDEEALEAAKIHGMKEIVHMFEAFFNSTRHQGKRRE